MSAVDIAVIVAYLLGMAGMGFCFMRRNRDADLRFRALFHKYVGLPPQSFMLKCRIRKAEDLLKRGDASVTDVAYELGFSSPQNFAIRFRQETGMSPTDWKKRNS